MALDVGGAKVHGDGASIVRSPKLFGNVVVNVRVFKGKVEDVLAHQKCFVAAVPVKIVQARRRRVHRHSLHQLFDERLPGRARPAVAGNKETGFLKACDRVEACAGCRTRPKKSRAKVQTNQSGWNTPCGCLFAGSAAARGNKSQTPSTWICEEEDCQTRAA